MRMLWIYNVNASRAQMMGEKLWVFWEMCGMTLKNTMWSKLGVREWRNAHLTTQRAESKWVQEASATDFTNVGDSFDSSFWLRPLIQEQNSGTVYHIGLNPTDVQNLLYLRNSHHIMVRRPPYLKFTTKTGWEKQAQCRRKQDSKKGFENWGKQKKFSWPGSLGGLCVWKTCSRSKMHLHRSPSRTCCIHSWLRRRGFGRWWRTTRSATPLAMAVPTLLCPA